MKKYLVCYWTERNDVATDLEEIVEANNMMEALEKFTANNIFKSIDSISLIMKQEAKQEKSRQNRLMADEVGQFQFSKPKMYSEEEVFNICRAFATFVMRTGPSYKKQQDWFEQFKKK